MRGKFKLALMALMMMACSKEGPSSVRDLDYDYGKELAHEKIVLGERLENPYKTENITKALNMLYPTKADRVDVRTTDLYVRFLPATQAEYDTLSAMGLRLIDHPLDYAIAVEGDWYHDPEVSRDSITWQYAVVPTDFVFPDIRHEIIDECYLSENDAATRSDDGIDWDEVERQAYILTGNESMLEPQTRAAKSVRPKGRITIEDKHFNKGRPIGVAGVQVSCNSFVKFDDTYTDENGYYEMSKKYNSDIRYRLIFKNKEGFSIGFNLILVPASVSTLGKASASGINMTVTKNSEDKLFKRCAANNAAYDYLKRCSASDLDITPPPAKLRLWLFHNLNVSSAVMMHHNTGLNKGLIRAFLGEYATLIKIFLPDLTIGVKDADDYRDIYSTTCHELAHASHFAEVETDYWDEYIHYIIESFITSGGMTYGDGTGSKAGYCEVGEMWAYYLESLIYKERYGGNFPSFGNSYWFKPEIFRYLDDRGFSCGEIFSVLDEEVTSRKALERALIAEFPTRRSHIEQAFDKY
ncbi:MAG: hypothetical protein J6J25_02230 [Bacteroidales bacterium]|nr:hypothetical protein [Bacteroidales bacterium]